MSQFSQQKARIDWNESINFTRKTGVSIQRQQRGIGMSPFVTASPEKKDVETKETSVVTLRMNVQVGLKGQGNSHVED